MGRPVAYLGGNGEHCCNQIGDTQGEQRGKQAADILAMQGLYADARSHLNVVLAQRQSRGDTRGSLQAKIRIGTIDPADYNARRIAVSARSMLSADKELAPGGRD